MTLALTGATGHLGGLVVDALIARGVAPGDILGLGRSEDALARLADRGIRTARVDYDRPETLAGVLDGVDRLLLISGSEVGHRVAQHANVVQAAVTSGVGSVAYTSAPKADTSDLILAPEHKKTEELLAESGLPHVLLRNNWYTENYTGLIAQAEATGALLASSGEGRVASASRIDYAEAAARVLAEGGHDGRVYELAGDVAWRFEELAEAISHILGRPVEVENVSGEEHLTRLTAAGADPEGARFAVTMDRNIRDGALADADGSLAALIGRPTTPLEEGLRADLAAQRG